MLQRIWQRILYLQQTRQRYQRKFITRNIKVQAAMYVLF